MTSHDDIDRAADATRRDERAHAPVRYRDDANVQRIRKRRHGLVDEQRDDEGRQRVRVTCPGGHRFDLDGLPIEDQRAARCKCPRCGVTLWFARATILVVEVTPDELPLDGATAHHDRRGAAPVPRRGSGSGLPRRLDFGPWDTVRLLETRTMIGASCRTAGANCIYKAGHAGECELECPDTGEWETPDEESSA